MPLNILQRTPRFMLNWIKLKKTKRKLLLSLLLTKVSDLRASNLKKRSCPSQRFIPNRIKRNSLLALDWDSISVKTSWNPTEEQSTFTPMGQTEEQPSKSFYPLLKLCLKFLFALNENFDFYFSLFCDHFKEPGDILPEVFQCLE